MAKAGVVTLSERRRHIVPAEQRLKRVAIDRDRVHDVGLQVVKDAPDADGQIGPRPKQQLADKPFASEIVPVDTKRFGEGKRVSVSVDHRVRQIAKKQKNTRK